MSAQDWDFTIAWAFMLVSGAIIAGVLLTVGITLVESAIRRWRLRSSKEEDERE